MRAATISVAVAGLGICLAAQPRSLHGIPIALKDKIHTTNVRTTGGALALADLVPPYDATITRQLGDAGAVKGARIGIPRAFYYDPATAPGGAMPTGGLNADQRRVMDEAIAVLKDRGAFVIDPADIRSVVDPDRDRISWCGRFVLEARMPGAEMPAARWRSSTG